MKKENKQITIFCGVLEKDGKIVMQLRDESECPGAHFKWEFPGGKLDFGETAEESVKREFMEETGIEVSVKELLPYVQINYWTYEWGVQQTICLAFRCEFIKHHRRKKDHHVAQVAWFTPEQIKELDSLPGTESFVNLVIK